jgi:hypothetical protein
MGTVILLRCIAVVLVTATAFSMPISSAASQGLEGCLASGVAYPVDYYLPTCGATT